MRFTLQFYENGPGTVLVSASGHVTITGTAIPQLFGGEIFTAEAADGDPMILVAKDDDPMDIVSADVTPLVVAS